MCALKAAVKRYLVGAYQRAGRGGVGREVTAISRGKEGEGGAPLLFNLIYLRRYINALFRWDSGAKERHKVGG